MLVGAAFGEYFGSGDCNMNEPHLSSAAAAGVGPAVRGRWPFNGQEEDGTKGQCYDRLQKCVVRSALVYTSYSRITLAWTSRLTVPLLPPTSAVTSVRYLILQILNYYSISREHQIFSRGLGKQNCRGFNAVTEVVKITSVDMCSCRRCKQKLRVSLCPFGQDCLSE